VYRLTGWGAFWSELIAVVSFYFLFLTVIAAVIVGLFNISRSERERQDPSPGIERNATATKREPRLFKNTDRLRRKQPTLLQSPPKKQRLKKASTTNQGRALMAGTRAGFRARRAELSIPLI
jgi:hypothetical protein